MSNTIIALADCRHRCLYRLHSRNLVVGVFDLRRQGFVGLREKFDHVFAFTEYHVEVGQPLGTARPLERIAGVELPPGIALRENSEQLKAWLQPFDGAEHKRLWDEQERPFRSFEAMIEHIGLQDQRHPLPPWDEWMGQTRLVGLGEDRLRRIYDEMVAERALPVEERALKAIEQHRKYCPHHG